MFYQLTFQMVFSDEMERSLVQYIVTMEEIIFGIGTAEVCRLAF